MSDSYPQIIPRPDRWEPGGPAPWAHLDPEARRGLSLSRVRASLSSAGLLGVPTEPDRPRKLAVVADGEVPRGPTRHSSVLIALFEEHGEARVLLTRRASHLRTHRGEVSFPGGRIDEGEHPRQAALREAYEEVELDAARVEVVGHLLAIETLVANSLIQPVVGFLGERPWVRAAPQEVERVFDVALADLVAEGVFHEELWYRPDLRSPDGGPFPLWFFETSGEMIWGATGRLLVDLLSLVVGTPAP